MFLSILPFVIHMNLWAQKWLIYFPCPINGIVSTETPRKSIYFLIYVRIQFQMELNNNIYNNIFYLIQYIFSTTLIGVRERIRYITSSEEDSRPSKQKSKRLRHDQDWIVSETSTHTGLKYIGLLLKFVQNTHRCILFCV